jgi:hypothetical protein
VDNQADEQRKMRFAEFLILLLTAAAGLNSQSLLKIHNADLLKQDIWGGKIIYGNVDIEYDVYRVKCDSAVINKEMTNARLFKNIQFTDTARTIKCNNATLSKTPNGRMAYLAGKVSIREKDILISGNDASMNEISKRIAVSDSVIVKYFEYPSILFCSNLEMETEINQISSQDLDSVLCLDSLRYYKLYAKRFRYDTEKKYLNIDTKIDLYAYELEVPVPENQTVDPSVISRRARSQVYAKKAYFTAFGGSFYFDPFSMQAQGKCSFVLTDTEDPDTLNFNSDRISYDDLTGSGTAKGKVSIRKGKMNIKSGLAEYFRNGRTAKFFEKPVVIYEDHRVTGDSMTVKSKNNDFYPEEAVVYGNPRYESSPDSLNPGNMNILTGKLMNLWFSDSEINKIIVSKEAEGVYFISKDGKSASDASNYLLGDEIELNFSEGDIKKASIKGGCEGIYYPDKIKQNALKNLKK